MHIPTAPPSTYDQDIHHIYLGFSRFSWTSNVCCEWMNEPSRATTKPRLVLFWRTYLAVYVHKVFWKLSVHIGVAENWSLLIHGAMIEGPGRSMAVPSSVQGPHHSHKSHNETKEGQRHIIRSISSERQVTPNQRLLIRHGRKSWRGGVFLWINPSKLRKILSFQ